MLVQTKWDFVEAFGITLMKTSKIFSLNLSCLTDYLIPLQANVTKQVEMECHLGKLRYSDITSLEYSQKWNTPFDGGGFRVC